MQLKVICFKWLPLAVHFELVVNFKVHNLFKLIIFRIFVLFATFVAAFFLLPVLDAFRAEDAGLLQSPISKLNAELLIVGRVSEKFVRAHLD